MLTWKEEGMLAHGL